ncbi:anti-sigma factor family protein [Desulfovibrio psychrotolerans]|uniref:Putative zinc-finger domain-containing protein n=1 Tax=Desulfovibrio psychrotolerans TaxID=415242 RepID=A0A7J0BZT0_9BACT|nr:zf-HC2 domain-containing protein [Desulfovibrio psychrotolerans]GFM38454.1 hypothetical protein DSM19430T_31380 [Desulfovibrio psychrotolerans]
MKNRESLSDAGVFLWGGSMDEGLSRTSTFCPGYNDMSGYLDKMLSPRFRKNFEEHMASCRECRSDVLELRMCIKELFCCE